MGLLAVLLVRAAVADVGPDRDQARPLVGQRLVDRPLDRGEVVAVLDRVACQPYASKRAEDVLAEAIAVGPSSWMWLSS